MAKYPNFYTRSFQLLKWVFKDLILRFKIPLLVVSLLDILSIITQFGALAVLFRYVNLLESNQKVQFFQYEIDPSTSFRLLLFVAIISGLLFTISSMVEYLSKLKSIRLSRKYEILCSQRILKKLQDNSKISDLYNKDPTKFNTRKIKKSLIKDTRFCGNMVNLISHGVISVGKLSASLVFMFYIHLGLTTAIILILVPLYLLLRRSSSKVISLTRRRERLIPQFIGKKRKLFVSILESNNTLEEINEHYETDPIANYYNAYYSINRRMAFNDLITTSFIAIIAISIIMIAGNVVLFGDMHWSIFIAYMVALRFFFTSLRAINGTIKRSSKFYDYIDNYIRLLATLESDEMQGEFVIDANPINGGDIDLDSDNDDDDDDDDM